MSQNSRGAGSDVRTMANEVHGKVLALLGRADEARAAFERGIAITRAKGAIVWTAQLEALVAEL